MSRSPGTSAFWISQVRIVGCQRQPLRWRRTLIVFLSHTKSGREIICAIVLTGACMVTWTGIIALLYPFLVCWRCPVDYDHERLDATGFAGQVPLRGRVPGLARGRPLAEWGALSPLL